MQAEIARLGDWRRPCTESALFQQYYKCFSEHSARRGEGHFHSPVAGSQEQQLLPPRRATAPRRVRLSEGYMSRSTQTDPKKLAGLSTDEALSVHANSVGLTEHDIAGGLSQSRTDKRETGISKLQIGGYRGDGQEYLGNQKREYQDHERDDEEVMTEYESFHKEAGSHTSDTDSELEAMEQEDSQLEAEDRLRRKQRKAHHREFEKRRISIDGRLDAFSNDPASLYPKTDKYTGSHKVLTAENPTVKKRAGKIIDGAYYPMHHRFYYNPTLRHDQANPSADFVQEAREIQISSPTLLARKGAFVSPEKRAKTKKTAQSPKRLYYLFSFERICHDFRSNDLDLRNQATSKHPIKYDTRLVPLFDAMKLPRMSKRPGSAKLSSRKDSIIQDQYDNGRNERSHSYAKDAAGCAAQEGPKKLSVAEDKS
ncbi:uncharacterized protein RAG0_05388 [Rhynchosporium agropyri]|uniref:Uncharacterized protein n=1 Tax=Rhynchosporium agropyri TaxID=914238 RepID=A0A1E1KD24_9HELO|nr:uncharacterized protein RAG0_05388 [Rhynchosporium agropyri]